MSFASIALLGACLGAWLKHLIWKRSHNGIRGWLHRRKYAIRQKWREYRRRRFKRRLGGAVR